MNKIEIKQKLEELYDAQEKYNQLKLEFERKVRSETIEYVELYDVLGDFDDGMESVDIAMKELEHQMQIVGEEWDEERPEEIFNR